MSCTHIQACCCFRRFAQHDGDCCHGKSYETPRPIFFSTRTDGEPLNPFLLPFSPPPVRFEERSQSSRRICLRSLGEETPHEDRPLARLRHDQLVQEPGPAPALRPGTPSALCLFVAPRWKPGVGSLRGLPVVLPDRGSSMRSTARTRAVRRRFCTRP